jgi:hypothetical protein
MNNQFTLEESEKTENHYNVEIYTLSLSVYDDYANGTVLIRC